MILTSVGYHIHWEVPQCLPHGRKALRSGVVGSVRCASQDTQAAAAAMAATATSLVIPLVILPGS